MAARYTKAADPATETPLSPLSDLIRKRLRKFAGLLPKVLGEENPNDIHDFRVWSRRLQQALAAMFPKPRPDEAAKVVRALRQARRAVSDWRDCDVVAAMLKRRTGRIKNPRELAAWQCVAETVSARRVREIERARRKLAHRRLFTLPQEVGKLIDSATTRAACDGAETEAPPAALARAIGGAFARWQSALARARETSDVGDVHALRIQSKRLRYRIELARDLGNGAATLPLDSLRSLQDELGMLGDRGDYARIAADALADEQLLSREPYAASLLLRRLSKEKDSLESDTAGVLGAAGDASEALERWVAGWCARWETESPPTDFSAGEPAD